MYPLDVVKTYIKMHSVFPSFVLLLIFQRRFQLQTSSAVAAGTGYTSASAPSDDPQRSC